MRRAARWMLLPEDAAEVIADYEDIAAGRSDGELLRDMGEPEIAVRQLVERKPFKRWLRFFAAMALCAAVPVLFTLLYIRPVFRYYYYELPVIGFLLAMWYWRPERGNKPRAPLPKGLLPAMVGLLLAVLAVSGLLWRVFTYALHPLREFPEWLWGWNHAVDWFCVLLVPAGVYGLARARMYDRRWRAFYVLALASIALILGMMRALKSLSLDALDSSTWRSYEIEWAVTAVLGLIFTGLSLC